MSGFGEIDVVLPAFAASALSFVFIGFLYMKINAYPTGVNIDMDTRGNPGPKGSLVDELSAQVRDGSIKFLTVEYTYLAVFVLALAGTLFGLFYAIGYALPFPEAQPYKPSPLYGALMGANRFIQDQFKANPSFKSATQTVLTTLGKRPDA